MESQKINVRIEELSKDKQKAITEVQPPSYRTGLEISEVRTVPAISSSGGKTFVNPKLIEEDIKYICHRKIPMLLDRIEIGDSVRYKLEVYIKARDAAIEEQFQEVEYFRITLGFGKVYFHEPKQIYLLWIPENYQLYFLRRIKPYKPNEKERIDLAIELLEMRAIPVFKKNEDTQKDFEEKYRLLLE